MSACAQDRCPSLSWRVICLNGSLGEHAQAWDELSRRDFGGHPLLSAEFVESLLRSFAAGHEHLCIGTDAQGKPRAMCILQPESPMVWRSFLPSQAQIGPSLLSEAAQAATLFHALPWGVQQIDLLCCDPDFMCHEELHAPQAYPLPHALTVSIQLVGTYEAYLRARTKNLRANIKRYSRRIQDDGRPMMLRIHVAEAEVKAAVERYAALETTGWKGEQGTALGSNVQQLRFYTDLLSAAAADRRAKAYELYFGEKLVASRLTYQRGGMLVILKTTYDEQEANLAPGRLLLNELIRHEFSTEAHRSIEFYTDASPDTIAWSTGQRWIRHLSLYRFSITAPMIDAARALLPGSRLSSEREGVEYQQQFFGCCDDLPAGAIQLMEDAGREGSYLGLDWYRNLEQTVFVLKRRAEYAVLFHRNDAVAVLPVLLLRRRRSRLIQGLTSFYTPLFGPALAPQLKPQALAILLRALNERHGGVPSMDFGPLDSEGHAGQTLLAAMRLAGFSSFEYHCFDNWHVNATGNWETYLRARGSLLRSILARKGRRFAAAGGRFELLRRPDEIDHGLRAYAQVYANSWKKPEPFQEFVPGLVRTFARRGELRLGLALLGDEPVAAQVWIVSGQRAEIHKLAYDEKHKAFSPGTLLSEYLMRHVIEQDEVTDIDYLIGDDPYKQQWMDQRRKRWGVVAYNPRTFAGVTGLGVEVLGRVTKGIRNRLKHFHR